MRTIRTKVYQFSELKTKEAKQKAINSCQDINVFFDWWEAIYEDADNAGIKITSFDIDGYKYAKGYFVESALLTAKYIIANHGENCSTYKTAKKYYDEILTQTEGEFLAAILKDYANILSDEYDYQTSEAVIIETIEANEYEFKADGTRF